MEKEAFVCFCGIASGKSYFAEQIKKQGARIISADRIFFEQHRKLRYREANKQKGNSQALQKTIDKYKEESILVLDNTPLPIDLQSLRNAGFSIRGIHLTTQLREREKRMELRNKRQQEIVEQISKILSFDLCSISFRKYIKVFSSSEVLQLVDPSNQEEFEELVQELYLSGANELREFSPHPLNYDGIDHIVTLSGDETETDLTLKELRRKSQSIEEYQQSNPIHLCIWDIGGVLYKYSLHPLISILSSQNKNIRSHDLKNFSMDKYLQGLESFTDFCYRLCDHFSLSYSEELANKVRNALKDGIGDALPAIEAIQETHRSGIVNAVLSNALPELGEIFSRTKIERFIPQELQFLSYETGLLKPNKDAYKQVLQAVGIEGNNALFIDDKFKNTDSASAMGIRSIQLRYNTKLMTSIQRHIPHI